MVVIGRGGGRRSQQAPAPSFVGFVHPLVLHSSTQPGLSAVGCLQGPLSSFDAASIRRGHMVYTQVCASCHSLNRISYRNLVGVCYSEDEAKELAAARDVVDGPNDQGEMFERPGKLSDPFPAPYKNEEQARAINNGAYPPDLSLIVKARGRREDYIFALLLGYKDAPAGVTVAAGQYYNPYFPGSKIGMPKQLVDGAVDYPDGTPATESQMAKDVSVFLAWASEPEHDNRKRLGFKWIVAFAALTALTGFYKRFRCVSRLLHGARPGQARASRGCGGGGGNRDGAAVHVVCCALMRVRVGCAAGAPSRTARSPTPTKHTASTTTPPPPPPRCQWQRQRQRCGCSTLGRRSGSAAGVASSSGGGRAVRRGDGGSGDSDGGWRAGRWPQRRHAGRLLKCWLSRMHAVDSSRMQPHEFKHKILQ